MGLAQVAELVEEVDGVDAPGGGVVVGWAEVEGCELCAAALADEVPGLRVCVVGVGLVVTEGLVEVCDEIEGVFVEIVVEVVCVCGDGVAIDGGVRVAGGVECGKVGIFAEGVDDGGDDVAGGGGEGSLAGRGTGHRGLGTGVGGGALGAEAEGSEEGGRRASLFDGVVGFVEYFGERVDGVLSCFECADGEGFVYGFAELGEFFADGLGCEPVEECELVDSGVLGELSEVVVE